MPTLAVLCTSRGLRPAWIRCIVSHYGGTESLYKRANARRLSRTVEQHLPPAECVLLRTLEDAARWTGSEILMCHCGVAVDYLEHAQRFDIKECVADEDDYPNMTVDARLMQFADPSRCVAKQECCEAGVVRAVSGRYQCTAHQRASCAMLL